MSLFTRLKNVKYYRRRIVDKKVNEQHDEDGVIIPMTMTSDEITPAQANIQLSVRLLRVKSTIRKNTSSGPAGMSQVRVCRVCSLIILSEQ